MPNIKVQKFPTPSHIRNLITDYVPILIPVLFLMSFNFAFNNAIRYIATEKENQLKEAMKIMGLTNLQQHTSWFIRTMMMLLIPIVVITVLLKVIRYW